MNEIEVCPLCHSSEIKATDNYCQICGVELKTPRRVAMEVLQHTGLSQVFNECMRAGDYEASVDSDAVRYSIDDLRSAMFYLNHVFAANQIRFSLKPIFDGNFWDIVATDLKRKQVHDAQLTEHTISEAYEAAGFNRESTFICGSAPVDQRLTQSEYDKIVEVLTNLMSEQRAQLHG